MPTYSISKREFNAWKSVLKNDEKNWHSAHDKDKTVDFSYGYNTKRATIQPFTRTLGYFHDKLNFFKILNKCTNVDCVPVTYLSMDKFIKNRKNDNSLWFFKLSKYDCGSGVTPFFDEYESVKDVIKYKIDNKSKKHKPKEYIVQKGVDDLMLYHGHKFDIRIHILITQYGDVYIYKNACMRISFKKFSEKCDCKKHQCTNGSLGAKCQYTDKWPDWSDVYPSVKASIKDIILAMKPYIFKEQGKFLLIGADFIIDKNKKAWVLEFNTYPNLYYKQDPDMQPTITHMLKYMLRILSSPESSSKYVFSDDNYSWEYLMSFKQ